MDWFEKITGFKESSYKYAQSQLFEADGYLCSRQSTQRFAVGEFRLPSLAELREQRGLSHSSGRLTVRNVSGDARKMHADPEYANALFQVASQFNVLEMITPHVTPEDGVTRYRNDPTQGPACAIAAGAATIYRNYLVPVGNQQGQTAARQIDCLADLGAQLIEHLDYPRSPLWQMRNGYALATRDGLEMIGDLLGTMDPADREALKGTLRIGVQQDVQVTECDPDDGIFVSQAFCSAVPVAYSSLPASAWEPFARLVLEAAYEATVLAGLRNASRGKSNKLLLTRLGGGAFGNRDDWIDDAIRGALEQVVDEDLDVILVSHGVPSDNMLAIERVFS
ncbi:hypothetical protein [Aestuariicoccus sp. MJ-SS9]|uniref:hypothetical protein n=1 Tax=Aestuariicoccus sp. MJ-SS9 TaxID=3079855 RepID=UPI00290C9438|nr:hypothetical protein [Aestuariicoccus sp. MJ-SS9]MDU8912492.1 hypothetical protein [Aestuariicoccus sp. MJ-SS9]